jgi:hypothetical protein
MTKPDTFMSMLRMGLVNVHFDGRVDGAKVPEHLRSEPSVMVQYGYNLPTPIRDLEVDEWGVRATLSFNGAPFTTVVPWSAVWAIGVGEEGGTALVRYWPRTLAEECAAPRRGLRSVS